MAPLPYHFAFKGRHWVRDTPSATVHWHGGNLHANKSAFKSHLAHCCTSMGQTCRSVPGVRACGFLDEATLAHIIPLSVTRPSHMCIWTFFSRLDWKPLHSTAFLILHPRDYMTSTACESAVTLLFTPPGVAWRVLHAIYPGRVFNALWIKESIYLHNLYTKVRCVLLFVGNAEYKMTFLRILVSIWSKHFKWRGAHNGAEKTEPGKD